MAGLLALAFLPVVSGKQSLLPYHAGVMPEGPYRYEGKIPEPAVFDPAGSTLIDLPLVKLAGECWRRGTVPLWNPYSGCGTPLLGRPDAGTCSPMRAPLYLNSAPGVWNGFFLFRLWLAGVLAFHLARAIGLAFLPAFAGGVSYMLSGYLVLSLNLHHLDVESVLPGILLAAHLMMNRPSRLAFAGGALASWQLTLGNNPQPALLGFLLAAGWAMVGGYGLNIVLFRRRLLVTALMLGVGLAGGLFQILPFAEFASNAWHMHLADGSRAASASLPIGSAAFLAGPWAGGGAPPFYYAGVSVLVLAAAGMYGAGRFVPRPLALVMALTVALELAKVFGFPGMGVLMSVPLVEHIWMVKYAAPLFLSLALLAGCGVALLGAAFHRRTIGAAIAAAALVLIYCELTALRPGPHPVPHDPLEAAPYVRWLQERQDADPDMRICGIGSVLLPNLSAAFRLRDVRIESSIMTWEQRRILYEGLSAPRSRRLEAFVILDRLDVGRLSLLRDLGVRYLVAPCEYPRPPDLAMVYDAEVRIYEIRGGRRFEGFPERGRTAFAVGLLLGACLVPVLSVWGLCLVPRRRRGRA